MSGRTRVAGGGTAALFGAVAAISRGDEPLLGDAGLERRFWNTIKPAIAAQRTTSKTTVFRDITGIDAPVRA